MSKQRGKTRAAASRPWWPVNGALFFNLTVAAVHSGGNLVDALTELERKGYIEVRWDTRGQPKSVRPRGRVMP